MQTHLEQLCGNCHWAAHTIALSFEIIFLNLLPIRNTLFLGKCISTQRRVEDFHRPAFDLTPAQMAHPEGWGQEMIRKAGRELETIGKPKNGVF